ncbi:hypothetical protein [Leptolyngbya sp. BL0902]|uniref:hypothetical protein n=1 Tax=Leptolyngbya sp. BL0902 TaxID=1115757 RepID=UPI0029393B94|nr:hypothetical protein [Leptolyngbya sp. BL0902]
MDPNDRNDSPMGGDPLGLPLDRLRQSLGLGPGLGLDSRSLAQFIEARDGISKPWLLVLLRLTMLQERKDSLSPEAYMRELSELHQEMMGLGEWWVGIEDEVFNP